MFKIEYVDRFKLKIEERSESLEKIRVYIDKWPGKGLETVILKISSESLGTFNVVKDDCEEGDFTKLIKELTGKDYIPE